MIRSMSGPGSIDTASLRPVLQDYHYITNGTRMFDAEKQLFDCLLVAPETVAGYTAPFT